MIEFNSRSELNNYIYELFGGLTNSRQFLSKKMEKRLDADLLNEYEINNKLMTYNEKYILKMKFKEMYLERKMMRKNFREYRKNFTFMYKKIKPRVDVWVDNKPIKLSKGKLPLLQFKSDVEGNVNWNSYVLQPGVGAYSWTFIPTDKEKYTEVFGILSVGVIDDLAIVQEQ